MPTAPPPAPARGPVLSPADSWAGHHHPPFPPALLLVQTPPKLHQPADANLPTQLSSKFLPVVQIPVEGLPSTAVAAVTSRGSAGTLPPLVRRQIRESDLLTTNHQTKHPKSDLRNMYLQLSNNSTLWSH